MVDPKDHRMPEHPSHVDEPIVRVRGLRKTYHTGGIHHLVLDGIDLDIQPGRFIVLLGVSGSGKSTLLNLISGIDFAEQGTITIAGTTITDLTETQRTIFRRENIGIVFQFFNLIPTLSALENITLPMELRGTSLRLAEQRARALLARVGLEGRASDFPDRLSGGEQQRVAIARALIHEPALVLADEPTGNLDEHTGQTVLHLLLELTRQANKTLIMATHDPNIVPLANHVYRVHDGKVTTLSDTPLKMVEPVQTLAGV